MQSVWNGVNLILGHSGTVNIAAVAIINTNEKAFGYRYIPLLVGASPFLKERHESRIAIANGTNTEKCIPTPLGTG
jgi:hypothetical protein